MSLALRQRTAVVVFVGASRFSDRGAQALVRSQRAAGINVVYLGREPAPQGGA